MQNQFLIPWFLEPKFYDMDGQFTFNQIRDFILTFLSTLHVLDVFMLVALTFLHNHNTQRLWIILRFI